MRAKEDRGARQSASQATHAGRQSVKRSLKRFGEWVGRFAVQVHLGPRFGSFGARVIGADPVEDWQQAQREAEELDRKRALGTDEPER